MRATEKHKKGAKVYAETGNKSAAMRSMDRDPRNATRDFNTLAMREAQSAVMERVLAAARVSEARLGKVWDECLSATKTTELGTFPDYTNRRETLELVLRARGLLKGEDRLAEGALLATRLLLPLIARYVRPEDKAAFDADVAEVLQSNG